jgi:Domain of unknown function (DUF4873)
MTEKVADHEGVEPLEGYDGPATLVTADTSVDVQVSMRGMFEPIDGLYHWYGRIDASDAVDELVAALVDTKADLSLRTPHGGAATRLSDRDPWGRYRVTGTGRPPFEIAG